MTHLSPTALEAAAKATYDHEPIERMDLTEIPWGDLTDGTCDRFRHKATAAITAYLAQAEKEGWVMAPIEPTQVMLDAATSTTSGYSGPDHDYDDDVRDHYRAMLAAAQNGGE